jgi:hypothetical protein
MNNILKTVIICILFITGGIFLIISPFSKKESTEIVTPEFIMKPLAFNPMPNLSPTPEPFDMPATTKGVRENIDVIKSYTDLIADILQKIFGFITSGLGIFLTIKQLKDKKKKT